MLSKCANPVCSERFLYLRNGKLFRWEIGTERGNGSSFGEDPAVKKPSRKTEYFWLCDECAARMTLVFTKGMGITARSLARAKKASS